VELCEFCDSFVLGGECTNLNCKPTNNSRSRIEKKTKEEPAFTSPNSRVNTRNKSAKGNYIKYIQSDGSILIPSGIHLQYEVSLPRFMGYKTDKKADQGSRRNALRTLFESDYAISPTALNHSAINEFGPPSSAKRKTKLLSWFDGRIYKSRSKNLQLSKMKLVEDREFVSKTF